MADEIERGYRAKTLLESDIFLEVMNGLDGFYTAAWRSAKTLDAREDAYRYVKLIEKMITDIQTIARTGELHEARKKELEGKKRVLPWPT